MSIVLFWILWFFLVLFTLGCTAVYFEERREGQGKKALIAAALVGFTLFWGTGAYYESECKLGETHVYEIFEQDGAKYAIDPRAATDRKFINLNKLFEKQIPDDVELHRKEYNGDFSWGLWFHGCTKYDLLEVNPFEEVSKI